jgi:hypothetical protein
MLSESLEIVGRGLRFESEGSSVCDNGGVGGRDIAPTLPKRLFIGLQIVLQKFYGDVLRNLERVSLSLWCCTQEP